MHELRQEQRGKSLKILPKTVFLRFTDCTYFPKTPQRNDTILEPHLCFPAGKRGELLRLHSEYHCH